MSGARRLVVEADGGSRGNPGPAYPSLGGQHAPYTVAKLQFFRGGESYGKDANANVIMAQVAKSLSDEDIQSLATYIEGLHSANTATAKVRSAIRYRWWRENPKIRSIMAKPLRF